MTFATIISRARDGMHAPEVKVEIHLSNGLPAFNLVGLPETSVKESKERVRSALLHSGFEFPMRRLTVNLAPADLPKQGGRYDLPIAVGILIASQQLPAHAAEGKEFVGELGLSGEVRACQGLLPVIIATARTERVLVMPFENGQDNHMADYPKVALAKNLCEISAYLHHQATLPAYPDTDLYAEQDPTPYIKMEDIIGQVQAKKAVEIAAAGGHNLLMLGPPGTGKTMLAHAMPHLIPSMTQAQALEVATLHAISGVERPQADFLVRPYRSPHHTCSAASLVGGGTLPQPGEISLAHLGLLFLDELPEFPRKILDCLREPLETGEVMISRARSKCCFPARFQLVGAMNPSPCGHHDQQSRTSLEQIRRYLNRLSGPLLDRFDLSVDVPKLPIGALTEKPKHVETTASIRQRVCETRAHQLERQGCLNSDLSGRLITQYQFFSLADLQFLEQTVEKLKLSVRSYHRIQRVALTIADLEGAPQVERRHIAQALGYRAIDKLMHALQQN